MVLTSEKNAFFADFCINHTPFGEKLLQKVFSNLGRKNGKVVKYKPNIK